MADQIIVEANGARIPAIGLGTFRMQGETCSRAVEAALRGGYRHVDTAVMYGNEDAVGAGIKSSGVPRDEIFVTTKVWHDDIGPDSLLRSAEDSLKRLGLSAVDLLLIHWPNRDVPLAASTKALCEAKKRGYARHIGVSNYPVALLDEAIRLADEPLVANQVEYHPRLEQSAVLAACRRHGLALTSYCPLGRGELPDDPSIRKIAERHGVQPSQVILRWHVQQPGVVAIPKSATPKHIAANLDVFGFSLSDEEMRAISALRRPDGRLVNPGFAPDWDRAAAA